MNYNKILRNSNIILIIFSVLLLLSLLSWNQFLDAKSDKIKDINHIHPRYITSSYSQINASIKGNQKSCNCVVLD